MNEYEQILQKAKEQGLDFTDKNIVIPIAENKFMFNGTMCFGRAFDNLICVLRDVEEPLADRGFIQEPFIYRIVDKYNTWITGGTIAYRIDFYIVE